MDKELKEFLIGIFEKSKEDRNTLYAMRNQIGSAWVDTWNSVKSTEREKESALRQKYELLDNLYASAIAYEGYLYKVIESL